MKIFIILAVIGTAFGAPTENTEGIQRWKEPVTLFLAPAENGRRLRDVGGEHPEEHNMQRSYYDIPAGVSSGVSAAAAASAISAAASGAGVASSGGSGGSAGSALGIFPGAKLGGCAIPLLLSCAPTVHSGHLAQPHLASYAAPGYRTDMDHKMRASDAQWQRSDVSQFSPVELQSMDGQAREMEWMQGSERAMETEMNHHHHLVALDIHPTNHH